MYLTAEARQEKVRRRQDEIDAQLQELVKQNLARQEDMINRHKDLNDKFRKRQEALRKRERDLLEREKILHERELSLKQQGRDAEENVSQGRQINDVGARPDDQPLRDPRKDLPTEHAKIVEDGPAALFPPSAVSPTTPYLPKTPHASPPPASPPPASPPPASSIPSSSPVQSPFPKPKPSNQDAGSGLSYSCIKCSRPDDQLMIACQNGKACLSRKWCQKGGGIHSGSDAWFHISHLGMTEAELYDFTKSKEDWYCPQCQRPTGNTDPDKYTMIKLRRQAETHEPKKPTTTKRCREEVAPDSKKPTNGEKSTKKSNRRKQVFWTNPLECSALIDSMRIAISTNAQTEQKYAQASELMWGRGFDRSPWQVKNKWNRALREEAQRQGVPEDRHEKAGRKLVTGVQSPAARKRKRQERRRALEESLVDERNTRNMEDMQDVDERNTRNMEEMQDVDERNTRNTEEMQDVDERNTRNMEEIQDQDEDEDGEGEEDDYEEEDDDDDDDEDDEEAEPMPKRQRFS